jgi:hypothetical protein
MTSSYAQSNKLKIILDESGETYVKGFVRGQFWARYLDMNPGTSINSEEVASSIFLFEDCEWEFQLLPKIYVYSMFGGNNINLK